MADLDWVDELKVVDLRKKLKEMGENASGKKAVLAERLKAKLTEQAEEKEAVDEGLSKKGDERDGVSVEDVEMEKAVEEEAEGGLNELLGDGKDDLKFDFEAEKPTRKKQKTAKAEKQTGAEKTETAPVAEKAAEKKATEEELLDFETPQAEAKEGPSQAQTSEPARTTSAAESLQTETPEVPEEERTCALHIQNFVRPFTDKAAKEMLTSFGTVVDMWMPPIKTHCFVIYESPAQAHEAYLGTYSVVWPRGGRHLKSQYVAVDEAKKAIEEGRSKALFARASGSASFQKTRPMPYAPNPRAAPSSVARPPSKPALALEDLFCKTQAKPPIYYLPLTDEQVADRKRQAAEASVEGTGEAFKHG